MITNGKHYRLKSPTIAVTPDERAGHKIAITIPAGGIVEILHEAENGVVTVGWERMTCEMFGQDLHERGEEVPSGSERERLPF
jgi:hypothetical protein